MEYSAPYTLLELQARFPFEFDSSDFTQFDDEATPSFARPVPPMTADEAENLACGLMNIASERPLTEEECFLSGQFRAAYRMAIQAETLGAPRGRYIVVALEDLERATRMRDDGESL